MAKKNTYSLYMAKPEVTSFHDLLTENAKERLSTQRAYEQQSHDFAGGATLYVFPGEQKRPRWVEQLSEHFSLGGSLFNQSHSAILMFRSGERLFALTFSYAHVYLQHTKFEGDFGLKVAINFVSDEKLRSVERSNIGVAIRDLAYAAGQKDLHSFGFSDPLDLIRKVSGYAREGHFADRVTGARALTFTKEISVSEVPEVAKEAIDLFYSESYTNTSFSVLDSLSPVFDTELKDILDSQLVAAIREGSDEFEIGMPEIPPEDTASYRFESAGFTQFYPDLSLEIYRDGLGSKIGELDIEKLKKHQVAVYDAEETRPYSRWSVFHGLVGSIAYEGKRYALNEGLWYRVDDKYRSRADSEFQKIVVDRDENFPPFRKIYTAK